ncbi:FAD-binding protein [Ramlibacter sp.]|uniref:FAD-binding protein n=1 Tax=Ramlibacter sp. TaxID=1917967 RepID=UPI0039C8E0CF
MRFRDHRPDYNASLSGGAAVSPPRSAGSKPWPITQAPFHALEIAAGITYTMGGIATGANAQVLDTQEMPIEGLHAAGTCAGGLEGGGFAGYSGGLTKSSVFGLLSGERSPRLTSRRPEAAQGCLAARLGTPSRGADAGCTSAVASIIATSV